ncbi:MAG: hypothetical protein P1U90_10110 [Akkermansiaceae bacterium]|nr:hypothetical protein [Akkermansiaceae bacterium]
MTYENELFHASVHPVGQATRMNHTIYELESTGPAFEASMALEDRLAGLTFRPTPVIRSSRFFPTKSSDGSMQAELAIDNLSAERAPLKSFYQGFQIQGSPTLKRGSWVNLGELEISEGQLSETRLNLPNGPKLFLRVAGVEPDENY